MKEILSALTVVSGDTKTESVSENFSLDVSGTFKMTKGSFTQKRSYWAKLYEMKYKGYISIDDWGGDEDGNSLGEMPIDDLSKLRNTLRSAGLSTVAESLCFDDSEVDNATFQFIEKNKMFAHCFGKKAKLFCLLPNIEQTKIELQYTVDNYDDSKLVSDYDKNCYGIVVTDAEGNENPNGVASKEQLIAYLATL